MALSEISNPLSAQNRLRLDAFFATIGQGFNAWLEVMSRRNEIEALFAKTDAELADMGLTREDTPAPFMRNVCASLHRFR